MRHAIPILALALGCGDAIEIGAPSPPLTVVQPDAGPPDMAPADAALPDLGPRPTPLECFAEIEGELGADYDRFQPVMGRHCLGTDHQDIQNVERLVFLGDSVTFGTPPARPDEYYRRLLGDRLRARFGPDLVIDSCARNGARTDDLLLGRSEIAECFPDGGDPRRTLVVFTIGGNDIAAWAGDGLSSDEAHVEAEQAAALLQDAVDWLLEPERFPNGIDIIYSNPYEYTDATGDLTSCELAEIFGFSGNWIEGAQAVLFFQERFLEIAVTRQIDMIFSLEHFCGHGYRRDDPDGQCYRGPDAELWFDLTCIHPNIEGHRQLARMFEAVVVE